MRVAWVMLLLMLPGCFDCSGTIASWVDEDAGGFLRQQLGAPIVHPYQGDAGFGTYGIADAYLISILVPESLHDVELHHGSIRYSLRPSDDRDALRAEVIDIADDVYLGQREEFEAAFNRSLQEVDDAAATVAPDDLPYYVFWQHAALEGEWDLDGMWAATNGTKRLQSFAYGVIEGEWSFRYRLAEWRFSVAGLGVAYDTWGRAEAQHDRNVDEATVRDRVSGWFAQRGGTAAFDGLEVSHIQC